MTPEAVRAAVVEVFHRLAPEADWDSVDPDHDLREQLDIDSMDYLNANSSPSTIGPAGKSGRTMAMWTQLAKLVAYTAKRAA